MTELEFRLGVSMVVGLIMLWPLCRIFTRIGKSPIWAFMVFIPILGWLGIYLVLVLSRWPSLPADVTEAR
ncbi:MAG: hypothetical protein GKS01_05175 [Alphaproteobacteria bacterium]|nr:hypothetical protein [Alphaproteobacteria bacterium]